MAALFWAAIMIFRKPLGSFYIRKLFSFRPKGEFRSESCSFFILFR